MDVSEIVKKNLERLVNRLSDLGVSVGVDDIRYSILNREEWIYIASDDVYPSEDIPDQFGVYRGYSVGGAHTSMITTELDRITPRKKKKAQELLDIFKDTLTDILREVDSLTDPEHYDSASI